ncbi:MAG TPA: LamG domain-containing protein, partial [Planctomycetes bacterium]|nr:LamG domain-containing protein [Planctomycetota bacterium]
GLNDAEQMYVALSDGSNPVSVVNNPDANAAIQTSWQEWNILLTDFTNLDLSSVKKVYVGFGDRDYHPAAGGKGIVYIDDIRACPPRCVPEFGKPLADIAQPYDCTVDEKDMAVLLGDWLLSDELGTGLVARYEFEGNLNDISGNEHHGTAVGAIAYDSNYPLMGQVLSLPGGANQFVEIGEVGISGNAPTTIACWAKADHNNIPDWTLVFGFTGTDANEGGNGSHFNIGSIGGPGGVGTHTWGWEETIFSDEEALEWHHYAMTYDGTTVQYFGDGVPMDTEPDKSNVQDLSIRADRVHIGSRVTQDSSFPGKVDDARIYKRVLSDAEIVTIMGGGEADVVHMPITSVADLYQGEPQGQQWINFRDYSVIAGSWLEKVLWP